MLRNYLKIAFRNLTRNKGYSFINIGGLALGMAVAMPIGLWMSDERSFDKNFQNYDRIVQVMQHITQNGKKVTQGINPYLLGPEIRAQYGSDFTHVLQSSSTNKLLVHGDKRFIKSGRYFEPPVWFQLAGQRPRFGRRPSLQLRLA
ncbi:hypothetical protein GCM10027275_55090 [Rhabdobacter roseus]|uniref:Uncharacterized protein n=1 Tax=Rhabdobacter roseus TaxID=1655419 RepID=A0A840TWA3_9BACT|nr:ABC transporter permease [Rhabdobacter roseus]MBB5287524.1 hypothetical protein [Rhabdobacter roseus]